jgi:hypothetical protein
MILNIIVIVGVLTIAMLWAIRGKGRGAFSSLLNFVCVVTAGAIAFSVWEPLVYGWLLDWREDIAWAVGLVAPFAVSLAVLRIIVEMSIPKNVMFDDATNFVGGAVFGLGAGVISIGIFMHALSMTRFGPDLLGYSPVEQPGGNLVMSGGLWVPVDRWTATLYEHVSEGSFSTDTPMADRLPDLAEHAAMMRMLYTDSGGIVGRSALTPEQFSVVTRYEGADARAFFPPNHQDVQLPDGEPVPANAKTVGFVVNFNAGAREESGQVLIGPGLVRLVYTMPDGSADAAHPYVIVADPEAEAATKARYPVNSRDMTIASTGGQSNSVMGFEFAIPAEATPRDLFVKRVRVPLVGDLAQPAQEFSSADQLVAATGTLYSGTGGRVTDLRRAGAVTVNPDQRLSRESVVNQRLQFPFGWTINLASGSGGLNIEEEFGAVTSGQHAFAQESLERRGLDQNLRANTFSVTSDTGLVQVMLAEMGQRTPIGRYIEENNPSGAPVLVDTQNRTYAAIGFIYGDGRNVTIGFNPGRPVSSLDDLPDQLSISKPTQTIILVYRPTAGVVLDGFAVGDQLVADFQPNVTVRKQSPRRR